MSAPAAPRRPWDRLPAYMRIGKAGEEAAVSHLRREGYAVIDRNVRSRHDEIDIVAVDPWDGSIVFCEVKTRFRLDADFRPELNITSRKRRMMARAARGWVARHEWRGGYRMDVICVAAGRIVAHYREIAWPT